MGLDVPDHGVVDPGVAGIRNDGLTVLELSVGVPLVVRLQGTKAEEGKAILAASGLDITPAETLQEAGERVVAAARGAA